MVAASLKIYLCPFASVKHLAADAVAKKLGQRWRKGTSANLWSCDLIGPPTMSFPHNEKG